MRKKLQLGLFLTLLIIGVQGKFTTCDANPLVEFSYTGICVGSPTIFTVDNTITNVNAVADWHWDFGDGFFSTLQNPTHTYMGFNIYTVTLTITDTLGVKGFVSHDVLIQKLPVPLFSYDTPNCSKDSIRFIDLSTTPNSPVTFIKEFVWDFGDGSPQQTINFPGDPNPNHLFPNPGTFPVTLEIVNSELCRDKITMPVLVTTGPSADFSSAGQCEDQLVTFTDASSTNAGVNIVAWDWDFGDPTSGINNVSGIQDPTHIFANTGVYTVRLIVTNFNNCSDTIVKQVYINPHPGVDFSYTATCLNEQIFFGPDISITDTASIGSWYWDFGDGQFSFAPNPTHAYTTTGSYNVLLKISDTLGCENIMQHPVVVNPLPVASFNANVSNCVGSDVQFNNQSSAVAGYIVRWTWDFDDGNTVTINHPANPNISHAYALPGTYNVTLTVTSSDSCTTTDYQLIVVHPNPIANFSFPPACFGSAINFTDLSLLNGASAITQWQWDFGDPGSGVDNKSGLQNPSHIYTVTGVVPIQLIVNTGEGCTDTISKDMLVKPQPAIGFNIVNNCQNHSVIFNPDGVIMNLSTITTWLWDFGDGNVSTLQSPMHTYLTPGTFNVTLTVSDTSGCGNSIIMPLTIIPKPNPNFSYSMPACKQAQIEFTNLSTVSTGFIVSSEWDFGDGTIQKVTTLGQVYHSYTLAGTFNVSLTIITNDSCKKTFTAPIIILPNPTADFSFSTPCLNSAVQFNDLSKPGTGASLVSSWLFGDPLSGTSNSSASKNPSHMFTGAGAFPVSLVVKNTVGCSDTIIKAVNIHPLPVVDFSSITGCVNDSTHFLSSTQVNPASTVSRLWNFGDGSQSTEIDPFHTYLSSGTFTVVLTVRDTNGCSNSNTHTIIIAPPAVSFFLVPAQSCVNSSVAFSNLSSTPSGTITSFFWEFGDGTSSLINAPSTGNISHTYTSAGTYNAVLTITTSMGCAVKSQRTLTIAANPLAQFSYVNTCAGSSVNFKDLSLLNSGASIVNWAWDFDDLGSGINNISTVPNPVHVYNNPGTYITKLRIENATGCFDTVSQAIIIQPKPAVDFTWTSGCQGSVTQFAMNTAIVNTSTLASYDWDFGDGSAHITSQQSPLHTFAGTGNFTVTLTIVGTGGCTNSVSHTVNIAPQPNSLFSFSNSCIGADTYFTDLSFSSSGEPIVAWHWDFGVTNKSNDTSNQQNPSWIYTGMGVYNVKLTVTSLSGCQQTSSLSLQVFGNPTPNFSYTTTACNNGAVYFQNSSYSLQSTIVSWNWEFEPNNTSNLKNPVNVFYATDSCYQVMMTAIDDRGCKGTVVKDVCVPAEFDFSFTASATCYKEKTNFSPKLSAPNSDPLIFYNWDFGDPSSGTSNTSTLEFPSHTFTQPGTYTVSLAASDINNCSKTVYLDVVVHALPIPMFSYTAGVCDSTINFTESASGNGANISKWVWDFGDGVRQTILSPSVADVSHRYASTGLFKVGLTVTNNFGCTNSMYESNVLVEPCINAKFGISPSLVCQNNSAYFADSSYSGVPVNEWYWEFGDGTDTTYYSYANPVRHVYTTSGTFLAKMKITTFVAGKKASDSTMVRVNVNPTPLPDFAFKNSCHEQNTTFTNLTSGNGTKINNFSWNFGEPSSGTKSTSTQKDPSHLYSSLGAYDVQLKVENTLGCRDSILKTVTIYGLPDANYEYTMSCAGTKTVFSDLSIETVAPLTDWEWTFSDNMGTLGRQNVRNPEFVFDKPGDYTVNLQVTDIHGCTNSIEQQVTTWEVPTSQFVISDNFENVQGQLEFVNLSTDATRYYWSFGDDNYSYSETPVALFQDEGIYDISLVSWNEKGCSDTLTMKYEFVVKSLYVPNAFSPENPKEEVRLFKPVGINIQEYLFEIYDRWGTLIWTSDKLDADGRPTEGWDGTSKGVLLPEGAYVWKAFAIFKDGTIWDGDNTGNNDNLSDSTTGTATLIR